MPSVNSRASSSSITGWTEDERLAAASVGSPCTRLWSSLCPRPAPVFAAPLEGALKADVGCSLDGFAQSSFPIVEFCCVNWLLFLCDHTEAAVPLFELVVRWLSRQDPLGVVILSV